MYCVIGNPIKHSLSKYIQNIFLKSFNYKSCYYRFKIITSFFYKKILELLLNNFNFNITIPHKEKIIKVFNYFEKRNISFNVLSIEKNSLLGFNTDKYYFNKKFNKTKSCFILLGFGGVSKSIILNFIDNKIPFLLYYYNKKKVFKFSKIFKKKILLLKKKNFYNNIVIDCTPCILYNIIPYNIKNLKLISLNYKNIGIYKKNGIDCLLGGGELLVIQAFQAFIIWNKIYNFKLNRDKKYIIKNFYVKN